MSATRLIFTTGSFSLRTIPTDCEYLLKKPSGSRANNSPHRLHILFFLFSSLIFFLPGLSFSRLSPSSIFPIFCHRVSSSFRPGIFLHSEVITQPNVSKQVHYARASNYRYARIWNAMTVSMEPRGSIELFVFRLFESVVFIILFFCQRDFRSRFRFLLPDIQNDGFVKPFIINWLKNLN